MCDGVYVGVFEVVVGEFFFGCGEDCFFVFLVDVFGWFVVGGWVVGGYC